MHNRPDKPLIVKCAFDRWTKRITFSSARNCTYDLLRHRVEQCFSLSASSYAITYKDDDGEITNITTDADLTEAIQYFQVGDDAPLSSAASILSGRSFGGRKITLRVQITVDYDGPSLSDSGSLASLEEYKGRNGSQQSFSFGAPSIDLDDDSVTVSSRDTNIKPSIRPSMLNGSVASYGVRSIPGSSLSHSSSWQSVGYPSHGKSPGGSALRLPPREQSNRYATESLASIEERYPADPAAVFERLKLQETLQDDTSSIDHEPLGRTDRGAAWLRDQNERAIRSKLGALPEPSETDSLSQSLSSIEDEAGGELALERGPQGKYYYTYTSGSSVSHTHEDGSTNDDHEASMGGGGSIAQLPRPTSLHLNWLAAQQVDSRPHAGSSTRDDYALANDHPLAELDRSNIDKELPFLPFTSAPPADILTDCSACGAFLDSIRYVCSTCGEKHPMSSQTTDKGKDKVPDFTYPPNHGVLSSSNGSSSSRTYIGSSETVFDSQRYHSLPSHPSLPSLSNSGSQHSLTIHNNFSRTNPGFELCPNCIETSGVDHAVQCGLGPSYGNISPSSPGDSQQASELRRSAPKKGQVRHAYKEKLWGHSGWEDVVHDDAQVSTCSTCSAVTSRKRYKCASCPKMHLCRACYSQVHELHPMHAFFVVPDAQAPIRAAGPEPSPEEYGDNNGEISLKHPGVKCAHCLLDIVGARFHCAICDSVDICSNCESAGLPGNLDSDDGGHNSSHILIKIPYPLENTELQSASRKALHSWFGRDAAAVGYPVSWPKAESEASYARTVIGSGSRNASGESLEDHRIPCNNCNKSILGTRYQCAHCPSSPMPYSLCAECEVRSYFAHDPNHVFFKLPRPVQRPIASASPLLPPLYKIPAGPSAHHIDPKAYLKSLLHSSAICDRCMTPIEGAWFRCAYCPTDLCECCEEVDTHNDKHIFMVFKSQIDMQLFKSFALLDNPEGGPPVIPYPIYR